MYLLYILQKIIENEENFMKKLVFGENFKIYKNMTIEIPRSFKDE